MTNYQQESTIEERFEILLSEGKQVEATSPNIDINLKPEYFDEESFKRAQKTCQKYYTNISLASATGLLLLVQLESILIPLLKTGRSRTVPDLFDRYVATAKYVRKYYETDFYQPTSEGWKALMIVRGMHKRIHQLMNEKNAAQQEAGVVWVNQYDMAITQFAFIGLFLLFPNKCAAYSISEEELKDIVYYWRLISYWLGIEERFNLFVFHEDLAKQTEYLNLVLKHQEQLLSGERDSVGLQMAKGITYALEDFTTETNFNILDHWWFPQVSLSGLQRPQPYSASDLWKLSFFMFYFKVLFRNKALMGYMNEVYKKKFDKFAANGEKIKKKLGKKYSNYAVEAPTTTT